MEECIFCKIASGEIPSSKVYEDEHWFAFKDISPCAPVHILVIPKKHIRDIFELTPEKEGMMSDFFSTVRHIAMQEGLQEKGFRLVVNTGAAAGQTVFHFQALLIGGRELGGPPFSE